MSYTKKKSGADKYDFAKYAPPVVGGAFLWAYELDKSLIFNNLQRPRRRKRLIVNDLQQLSI